MTAADISQRVLDRVAAQAERRGLRIDCQHRDANALNAFQTAAFDLVSAHYASIPRTPDDRGVRNLLNAVAPGGTLLIVSHDLEPWAPIDTQRESRPFDGEAFVRVEDFVAALAESPEWDIETRQKQPRPPGAASTPHHGDDIVLRARRRATQTCREERTPSPSFCSATSRVDLRPRRADQDACTGC